MNRFVLACLCVAACSTYATTFFYDDSVSSNRTPKQANWADACDECQIIIKRIVAVAKDRTKLSELKALLSMLCRECSYEDECRLFVANLDHFLDELLPYLKDAHATCAKLHICSNSKLEQFHRVGMLYAKKYLNKLDGAKDLMCEECEFAAHELQEFVESKANQDKIKSFLEDEVCANLGQQLKGPCTEVIEMFLPDFFTELQDMLKDNHQFCRQLDLCPSSIISSPVPNTKTIRKHVSAGSGGGEKHQKDYSLSYLLHRNTQLKANKGSLKVSMNCLECRLTFYSLLFKLQTNKTVHQLANHIQHTMYPILSNTDDCKIELYAATIVFMSLQKLDVQSLCFSNHLCTKQEFRDTNLPSCKPLKYLKCESCKVISEILITEMAKTQFRADLIEKINHMACERLPNSLLYICENLTKSYVPIVLTRLLQKMDDGSICYLLHVCH